MIENAPEYNKLNVPKTPTRLRGNQKPGSVHAAKRWGVIRSSIEDELITLSSIALKAIIARYVHDAGTRANETNEQYCVLWRAAQLGNSIFSEKMTIDVEFLGEVEYITRTSHLIPRRLL